MWTPRSPPPPLSSSSTPDADAPPILSTPGGGGGGSGGESVRPDDGHGHGPLGKHGPAPDTSSTSVPCSVRLRWELRPSYPMFSLEEPPQPLVDDDSGDDASPPPSPPTPTQTVVISVVQSFAPPHPSHPLHPYISSYLSYPTYPTTPLIRLFLLAWAVQVLAYDVRHYPPHNLWIYMGYLTHWGHVLCIVYLGCSLGCSVCGLVRRRGGAGVLDQPTAQPGRPAQEGEEANHHHHHQHQHQPHVLVKLTWILYSTVAPLEIGITLLYWSAISTEPPTYISVMEHGGILLLILFDGLIVGLIPVRAKQVVYLVGVCCAYLLWTALDYWCDIGNGEWGPAYGDDDALYPVLRWGSEARLAGCVGGFGVLVLCPGLFGFVWLLSLASSGGTRSEGAAARRATGKDEFEAEGGEGGRRRRCCRCCCAGGRVCFCCTGCAGCCSLAWDGSRRPIFREDPISSIFSDGMHPGSAVNKDNDGDAFAYSNAALMDGSVLA